MGSGRCLLIIVRIGRVKSSREDYWFPHLKSICPPRNGYPALTLQPVSKIPFPFGLAPLAWPLWLGPWINRFSGQAAVRRRR